MPIDYDMEIGQFLALMRVVSMWWIHRPRERPECGRRLGILVIVNGRGLSIVDIEDNEVVSESQWCCF